MLRRSLAGAMSSLYPNGRAYLKFSYPPETRARRPCVRSWIAQVALTIPPLLQPFLMDGYTVFSGSSLNTQKKRASDNDQPTDPNYMNV